jgi:hypothetical protein
VEQRNHLKRLTQTHSVRKNAPIGIVIADVFPHELHPFNLVRLQHLRQDCGDPPVAAQLDFFRFWRGGDTLIVF